MVRTSRLRFHNDLARDPVTGRYHVRVMVHGRMMHKAFPSRRAAIAALEHARVEATGTPTEMEAPTLQAALDSYLERLDPGQRSESTESYYRLRMRPLVVVFGELRLDRLDQRRVEEYVAARLEEVGAGTINKELRALTTIYSHHQIEPRWKLPPLAHHPAGRMVQSPATVAGLWRACSPPARAAIGLCLLAGLRAGEALAAEASWVHGNELWVPVRKPVVWNRTAIVPTLAAVLPAKGRLVAVGEGRLRYELEEVSQRLGVTPPYLGPGAFRHHCAQWAVDAGCSRDQVREVLSHQAGAVTDRTVNSQALAVKRRVLEAVERVFVTALEAASALPDAHRSDSEAPASES